MANNIRFTFGSKLFGKFRNGNNDSPEDKRDTTLEKYEDTPKNNDYLLDNEDIKLIQGNLPLDSNQNFAFGGSIGGGDRVRRLAIKNAELSVDLLNNRDPYTYMNNNTSGDDQFQIQRDPNPAGKTIDVGLATYSYPNDFPPQRLPCSWCQVQDNNGNCVPYEDQNPCEQCSPLSRGYDVIITYKDSNKTSKAGVPKTTKINANYGQKVGPSKQCKDFEKNCYSCKVNSSGECVGIPNAKTTPCDKCVKGEYVGCDVLAPGSTCENGVCKPSDDDCGGQICEASNCEECRFVDPKKPFKGKKCVSKCEGSNPNPDCVEIFTGAGKPKKYGCGCVQMMKGCNDPSQPDLNTDFCSCECTASDAFYSGLSPAEKCDKDDNSFWDSANCTCVKLCDPPCEGCEVCVQQANGSYACEEAGEPVGGAAALSTGTCSNYNINQFPYNLMP